MLGCLLFAAGRFTAARLTELSGVEVVGVPGGITSIKSSSKPNGSPAPIRGESSTDDFDFPERGDASAGEARDTPEPACWERVDLA